MAGNDFVMVQLTAIGAAFAGGHPVTVSNGRRTFTFTADAAQRVERSYEWLAVLSRQTTLQGEALFELAPTTSATAPVEENK